MKELLFRGTWLKSCSAKLSRPGAAFTLLCFCLFTVVALAGAYWSVFNTFAPYDDEGTMLVTLIAYLDGGSLYRDIIAQYGPFYYQFFGFSFELLGVEVTTNSSRIAVVLMWTSTSLLLGVATLRITRSLALGLIGASLAFGQLYLLTAEPMHPVGLGLLLLAGLILAVVALPERRGLLMGVITGAVVGGLLLLKVNLGLFAAAAVALAAVSTYSGFHSRMWIRGTVVALFIAQPLIIVNSDLSAGPWREMVTWATLCLGAVAVASRSLGPGRGGDGDEEVLRRWIRGSIGGFTGFVLISVIVGIAMGTSPAAIYEGVIGLALRQGEVFSLVYTSPDPTVMLAIIGLFGAFELSRQRDTGSGVGAGGLRIVAGLIIWMTAFSTDGTFENPLGFDPVSVPVVLAWLAAVPPASLHLTPYGRMVRVLLPALAVSLVLQIYPVAGTQIIASTIAFIPVGAICIADGWKVLRSEMSRKGIEPSVIRATAVSVLTVMAIFSVWVLLLSPTVDSRRDYLQSVPLPFPEASRLRLSQGEVDQYSTMVSLLNENDCTSLLTRPGLNSLYIWSDIPLPKPTLPGAWYVMLDDHDQRRFVEQMTMSPRTCAFRNDDFAQFWLRGRPESVGPGIEFLSEDFEKVAEVNGWDFLVERDR